jgi:hypothetical protein
MTKLYHLYIKTHNETGLKYLGQTSKDPFIYCGSGKYWLQHIKKHGRNISTEILLTTENKSELIEAGVFYSKKFDIVKSKEYANLIEEKGPGGSFTGRKHSEETKKLWSAARKGICWSNGLSKEGAERIRAANSKPKSEEHKNKLSKSLSGRSYEDLGRRKLTEEEKEKISASKRGKSLSEETKQKIRETLKSKNSNKRLQHE